MDSTESVRKTADRTGVSRMVFELVRRLLILKDRQVLSQEDEDAIDRAFQVLEVEGRYKKALGIVDPILRRYWQKGTRDGNYQKSSRTPKVKSELKAKSRFDRTLFTIREVCGNIDELQVPEVLSRPEREEAISTLLDSVLALTNLLRQVKRGP